jgi:hypothetical protein
MPPWQTTEEWQNVLRLSSEELNAAKALADVACRLCILKQGIYLERRERGKNEIARTRPILPKDSSHLIGVEKECRQAQ